MPKLTTSAKIMRIVFLLSLLCMIMIIFAAYTTKTSDYTDRTDENYISLDNSLSLAFATSIPVRI